MAPNNPRNQDKILDDLAKQVAALARAVTILAGSEKQVAGAIRDKKTGTSGEVKVDTKTRRLYDRQAHALGMEDGDALAKASGYDNLQAMLQAQQSRVARAAPEAGMRSLVRRLTTAQFPSGEEAVSLIGYGQAFGGGRIAKAYGLGALLRQSSGIYVPEGAPAKNSRGKRILYSSGAEQMTDDERAAMHAEMLNYDADTRKKMLGEGTLSEEQAGIIGKYQNPKTSEKNRNKYLDQLLGQGQNLSFLEGSKSETIQGLAKRFGGGNAGRIGSMMFGAGEGIMMASRALAGPIGAAVTAAQVGYGALDTLYDPARSAAGLGYGFSLDPTSKGFRESLGRSVETKISSLSFGLSGEQTAAARRAVESMGAGGPGSERMYDQYYRSMTDVIEQTQLGADVLAPFYEQFMRQGGSAEEIERLTKMLRDDLPKAAAASRMSLSQMAQMIQQTTEAVSGSPMAAAGRTKSEISQALTGAMAAGGPPGMSGIAGGMNALVTAQTASRLDTGYFSAATQAGQLQVTAAETLKQTLGNMTGDQLREFRNSEQGAIQMMVASQMTGLSNDDIQKLYDQGINDFQASAALTDQFSSSKLGKAKVEEVRGVGRFAGIKRNVTTSQEVIGTGLDLYKSSGTDIQSQYGMDIETIRQSLSGDDLNEFNQQLQELSGEQGVKTWELLQKTSEKIAGSAATDDMGSKDGTIDLSDEAKKYFKLSFNSNYPNPNSANNNWGTGGVTVGQ